jgi:hypothetical protein
MKVKLSYLIELIPGINQSRIKGDISSYNFYDNDDFIHDLANSNNSDINNNTKINEQALTVEGDILININKQEACLVSRKNQKKFIGINFIKVKVIKDLDKKYFIYLFNENKDFYKQKMMSIQSSSGIVKRIPINDLYNIEIEKISISKQRLIGELYTKSLYLGRLYMNKARLSKELSNSIINTQLENGEK